MVFIYLVILILGFLGVCGCNSLFYKKADVNVGKYSGTVFYTKDVTENITWGGKKVEEKYYLKDQTMKFSSSDVYVDLIDGKIYWCFFMNDKEFKKDSLFLKIFEENNRDEGEKIFTEIIRQIKAQNKE